jgi:hypothetical protein
MVTSGEGLDAALAAAGAANETQATTIAAMPDRTSKFTFFKLDSAWQRRGPGTRAEDSEPVLS